MEGPDFDANPLGMAPPHREVKETYREPLRDRVSTLVERNFECLELGVVVSIGELLCQPPQSWGFTQIKAYFLFMSCSKGRGAMPSSIQRPKPFHFMASLSAETFLVLSTSRAPASSQ